MPSLHPPSSLLYSAPRYFAGQLFATLLPGRRRRHEACFTMPAPDAPEPALVDRLIRDYLGHRSARHPARLEQMHRRFWERQTPQDWYELGAARHKTRHVPIFGPLISALGSPLKARQIDTVVEFGCGDGRWLAWLHAQWSSVKHFHGVDLCTRQIDSNRARYPDLAFEAMDLVGWARAHARPRSLFLTHCGVLEYLSQDSVDALLATLARQAPDSMLCLVEPIADTLALDGPDQPSIAHGGRFAWSHHYPARLRQAGLEILDLQTRRMDGYRMLVLIGRIPADPRGRESRPIDIAAQPLTA